MRRHWSGFRLKSKFTQHNFHYTCNLALHSGLWKIQSSFLFLFQWWQENLCVKVIDHSIVVLRFSESPQFLNTLNWGNLSPWQTAMWWICGTTTSSCTTLSSKHHWQIEQLDFSDFGLVSSLVFIWLLFVSISPSVLLHQSHASSSLFNPHLIFFQSINFHSKRLQGCIHLAPVKSELVPLVSLDWFFAQASLETKLEPCTAVTHVLFAFDENRGDSICQFACFLFQVIELASHKLCCSSTIFLWSSTQPI